MRFLIDSSLPRSVAPLVRTHGHDAFDARDIGLGTAKDEDIAAHAQSNALCLLSRDYDFADIRNYPPDQYAGLVVFELPSHAVVSTILKLVEAFLQRPDVLGSIAGRLAIVEPGRIRLRPAP